MKAKNQSAPSTYFEYLRFLEAHTSLGLVLSVTQSECLSECLSHIFYNVLKFFTIDSVWYKIVSESGNELQICSESDVLLRIVIYCKKTLDVILKYIATLNVSIKYIATLTVSLTLIIRGAFVLILLHYLS